MLKRRLHHRITYFVSSFAVVVGLVLIWRGIWYILDAIDNAFFGGNHTLMAFIAIVVGFLILYLPDKDLKELRKL